MRQIFLDTETTGLSHQNGDRIIEIGCVEMVNRKLTGHDLHFFLNPERAIDEGAFKVHGLSAEFLRDKPLFAHIAQELMEYLRGAELIIHNAAFDVGFLDQELQRVSRPALSTFVGSVTDSLAMAKDLYPGKRNSLDALCDRLGIDRSARTLHGALMDAQLLASAYLYMTRGQHGLLVEVENSDAPSGDTPALDLSHIQLPVLRASAQELAEHETVLGEIDKASKGKTIWPRNPPSATAGA